MQCEMCGKDTQLIGAIVEGVTLNVCKNCAAMGKVAPRPIAPVMPLRKARVVISEPDIFVVEDCAAKMRKAREKLGLTQDEFALRLNERASAIKAFESGSLKPSIEQAKKLEKALHIKLVEQGEDAKVTPEAKGSSGLTIGDIIRQSK